MRELKLEELTLEQKIGMVMNPLRNDENDGYKEDIYEMIRNRALGAVWIRPECTETLAKIREIADYPILIFTDAESGLEPYKIGPHNVLGCVGDEKLAYTFGKMTAVTARNMGYNVVCNPVLDMINRRGVAGSNLRCIGNDKYKVAKIAAATARGMHDGGVLTVAKHYPGGENTTGLDSHMAETYSTQTKEDLLENALYPYKELMKEDLIDGIMTKHMRFINIDDKYPASLSEKVINIIRELDFDGFAITDALNMMGVVAKFGRETPIGLSIAAGNDIALSWTYNVRKSHDAIRKMYDQGLITPERLDEAVRRVLDAQRKTLNMPKDAQITEEDIENYKMISKNSVYARVDEGLPVALDRDSKYCFIVLTDNDIEVSDQGKVLVDTFCGGWYSPQSIIDNLSQSYPNSKVFALNYFPTAYKISKALSDSLGYETVFITYQDSQAYIGKECLTSRIISLMEAMQASNRISTVVHFGNPYVLEDIPHIPRILVGITSVDGVKDTLEVLKGNYPAMGVLTYDVKFQ